MAIKELFESCYPNLYDKIKSRKKVIGGRELEVKLDDGSAYIFDGHDATLRQLPSNSRLMTRKEFQIEFGYRLRKLLALKGLTQAELGERINVVPSDISDYVRGARVPNFYTVDKIAKALDISTDELRYI